jgi:hypothetical protein
MPPGFATRRSDWGVDQREIQGRFAEIIEGLTRVRKIARMRSAAL